MRCASAPTPPPLPPQVSSATWCDEACPLVLGEAPPAVRADVVLPRRGGPGSLGFNHALRVDGRRPYVTSLRFDLPDWDRAAADDDDEAAHDPADDDGADPERCLAVLGRAWCY